jgi:hypothetical protein
MISSSCFFLRRSIEQNHGMGLALNTNSYLSYLVFLLVFLFSKLKGFSLARVIIMLHFFLYSFFLRCYSIIRSYRPT